MPTEQTDIRAEAVRRTLADTYTGVGWEYLNDIAEKALEALAAILRERGLAVIDENGEIVEL